LIVPNAAAVACRTRATQIIEKLIVANRRYFPLVFSLSNPNPQEEFP
jgi:hypothetical protein